MQPKRQRFFEKLATLASPVTLSGMDQYLTTDQLAQALGCTRQTVWRTAKALGIKPAMLIGPARLYHAKDLSRFRNRPTVGRPPAVKRKGKS